MIENLVEQYISLIKELCHNRKEAELKGSVLSDDEEILYTDKFEIIWDKMSLEERKEIESLLEEK